MRPRAVAILAGLLLTVPILAGCIAGLDPSGADPAGADDALRDVLTLHDDGSYALDVPVDVVLVGFDDGVAQDLSARLSPEPVEHASLTFYRTFPPDPEDPRMPLSAGTDVLPARPTADYRVHDAPDALFDDLVAYLESEATVEDGIYDANLAEAWLAEQIDARVVPVDEDRPIIVLLHGRDALGDGPGDHAWRYSYANGHLQPVRVFGERQPLVAMDLSAEPDPWVAARQAPKAYDEPVPPSGDATLEALQRAVVDITHFRVLQGAIYPITTRPCHAVTLVLGIRAGATTEHLPGYARAEEMLDVDGLEAGWENVTGQDNVHVDVKVLMLPHEDPVLDAVSRGSLATLDVFRWWLDTNWEDYWVEHEGCEPYVSFLVYGDAVDPISFGIAMYDVERSHRISFSAAEDLSRLRQMYAGPAEDLVNTRDGSRDAWDFMNLLYSHETGHLLGQRHPQDITTTDGGRGTWSLNSVWTAMSYQTYDRTVDFGAVDRANYLRNRAGFLLQEAVEQGLDDDPAFEEALGHLKAYEWMAANQALDGLLEQAG